MSKTPYQYKIHQSGGGGENCFLQVTTDTEHIWLRTQDGTAQGTILLTTDDLADLVIELGQLCLKRIDQEKIPF